MIIKQNNIWEVIQIGESNLKDETVEKIKKINGKRISSNYKKPILTQKLNK